MSGSALVVLFFFNDTATTEIYTLSLHDALPIYRRDPRVRGDRARDPVRARVAEHHAGHAGLQGRGDALDRDRKSTRLNSSHANISYAVFCLKKKIPPTPYLMTFDSTSISILSAS